MYFHLLANPTFWAVVTLCFTAVGMRDLSWKFYHRWWQPKLHHLILEVEASNGDPVKLTPAQWAEASARGTAVAGSGGTGGAEGGGGGGGGRSARVTGVESGAGRSGSGRGSGRTYGCGADSGEETGSMAPSRRSTLTDQLTVANDSVGGGAGAGGGGRRRGRGSRRNSELLESEWLEAGGVSLPREISPGGGVEMGVRVGDGSRRGTWERRGEERGLGGKGRAATATTGIVGKAGGTSSGNKGPAGAVYSDGVELGFGNDVGDAVWRRPRREEGGGGDRRRHVLAGLREGDEENGRSEALYGSGSGSGRSRRGLLEEDGEGYDSIAVHRRHTDSMSSLPSPGLAEEGHGGGATVTPATSHSRSLSWVRRYTNVLLQNPFSSD